MLVRPGFKVEKVEEASLNEEPLRQLALRSDGAVELTLAPYRVVTVSFRRAPVVESWSAAKNV